MDKTPILISGYPGKMAKEVMMAIEEGEEFDFLSQVLTGPEIPQSMEWFQQRSDCAVLLFKPDRREEAIKTIRERNESKLIMAVDYTAPEAAVGNAEFFCRHKIPFVMGTSLGGHFEEIVKIVERSGNCAVVAPNMSPPIVGVQAMLRMLAESMPGALEGFDLRVVESHQASKGSKTSATALAVVSLLRRLGINTFSNSWIEMVRERVQQLGMGVSPEHLDGHGHHRYYLVLQDKSVEIELRHNVNGRRTYAEGTLKALRFLKKQVEGGTRDCVFSMEDVLKG